MNTLGMENFPVFYDEEPANSINVTLQLCKGFDMDGYSKELQMAGFSEKEPFEFENDSLRVSLDSSRYGDYIEITIKQWDFNETLVMNQFPMTVQEIVLKELPLSNLDTKQVYDVEIECVYGGPSNETIDGYFKTLVANGFVRERAGTRKKYPIFTYKKDNKDNTVWEFETSDTGWNNVRWTQRINDIG